ncbi:MAG: DNA-directed RNA polymerase subunit omega [Oscillospiraceae bacterium]|jgi:DNA-directed RNA polymerase subunit omega|nr:DNA-directed RNA polymerase subunit omega [Oscillospiraceae bacterium]
MIKKTVDDLFKEVDSRYALVNAVARRAREIAAADEIRKEISEEKPVIHVLNELMEGTAKLITRTPEPLFDISLFQDDAEAEVFIPEISPLQEDIIFNS